VAKVMGVHSWVDSDRGLHLRPSCRDAGPPCCCRPASWICDQFACCSTTENLDMTDDGFHRLAGEYDRSPSGVRLGVSYSSSELGYLLGGLANVHRRTEDVYIG